MVFEWILGVISIVALIVVFYSDTLTGKKKHSQYFNQVQKPLGKNFRAAQIPDDTAHDSFFSKLNSI